MILGDGWAYGCPTKTGTLSLRVWLMKHYGGRDGLKYHRRTVPESHQDGLIFMTVRNPYDRARSLWRFHKYKGGPRTFEESATRNADWSLCVWRDFFGATLCLRIEDIEEEVRRLPFFDPGRPLPGHFRRTRGWESFRLDEGQRELVRRLYREDFEAFGYEP